jgi:hypothetical protein
MKKNYKKKLCALLGTLMLSSAAVAETDEIVLLPIFLDDTWKANAAFSATAGYMDIGSSIAGGGATYGFQLAFDCPVFTIPGKNVILQQIDLNFYDNNNLKLTTLEINPHYFWSLSDELRVGAGPGLGYIWSDLKNARDPNLLAGQLGFAFEYRKDKLYASFGSRYQWTESEKFYKGSDKKEDLDNLLTTFKVGYNF